MPFKTLRKKDSTKNRTKKIQCTNVLKLTFAALPTIVFGVFTIIFTIQQNEAAKAMRAQDQQINDETNRRLTLKEYIHDVKELLLDEQFPSKINETMLQIRALTLTALNYLDNSRKRDIILYLYENRLLQHDQPMFVDLHDANLNGLQFSRSSTESCRFQNLYLPGIYGEKLTFTGCVLIGAIFDRAMLKNAEFRLCSLDHSSFTDANLTEAILYGNSFFNTDFSGATFHRALIVGGLFARIDLTNTDLYSTNISNELLFGMQGVSMSANVMLNMRYPNGTFSPIIEDNLFQEAKTNLNCSQAGDPNWFRLLNNHTVHLSSGGIRRLIHGKCVYLVQKKLALGQVPSVKKYSLLIDNDQAMINFTAYFGINNPDPEDHLIMSVHFSREEGSTNYQNSFIKKVNSESFNHPLSSIVKIPPGARSISAWIICEGTIKENSSCYFHDAHLSIFIKTHASVSE